MKTTRVAYRDGVTGSHHLIVQLASISHCFIVSFSFGLCSHRFHKLLPLFKFCSQPKQPSVFSQKPTENYFKTADRQVETSKIWRPKMEQKEKILCKEKLQSVTVLLYNYSPYQTDLSCIFSCHIYKLCCDAGC